MRASAGLGSAAQNRRLRDSARGNANSAASRCRRPEAAALGFAILSVLWAWRARIACDSARLWPCLRAAEEARARQGQQHRSASARSEASDCWLRDSAPESREAKPALFNSLLTRPDQTRIEKQRSKRLLKEYKITNSLFALHCLFAQQKKRARGLGFAIPSNRLPLAMRARHAQHRISARARHGGAKRQGCAEHRIAAAEARAKINESCPAAAEARGAKPCCCWA